MHAGAQASKPRKAQNTPGKTRKRGGNHNQKAEPRNQKSRATRNACVRQKTDAPKGTGKPDVSVRHGRVMCSEATLKAHKAAQQTYKVLRSTLAQHPRSPFRDLRYIGIETNPVLPCFRKVVGSTLVDRTLSPSVIIQPLLYNPCVG